ncbi:thiolase family protein [Sulfitobacter sp. JB4-11]|uniref:thiolase family protein n=1 Tax=Sulfitobacter rhodophyticola TaxID=3238304 RepID=UPI003D818AB4
MTAHVLAACRSPVAPRGGALSAYSLPQLGAPVLRAALAQAGLPPDAVDEVIVSTAIGPGGNPARSIALAAGLPEHVAGLSIDRQCSGGMDALLLARALVESGAANVVVAGGVESYSRAPIRQHTFADGRPPRPYTQAPFTPWPDRDPDMAEAADALAQRLGIDRPTQDEWAVESHAEARHCVPDPAEMIPFEGLAVDSFTRKLTPALCARAPTIHGSITHANAAVAADAAAFCIVTSAKVAARHGTPGLRILGGATRGADPTCPGLAPLAAIQSAFAETGLTVDQIDVAEVMEAYAVQAIACVREAGLDPARVNLGGGALARGHPIGASGAINVVRLFHELRHRGGTGLATIAAAGGIGSALILGA